MRGFRGVARSVAAAAVLGIVPTGLAAQGDADHTYSSEAVQAGSRVYVRECTLCHGRNGDRVDGVDLSVGRFRGARSDDDLRRVVTEGLGEGRMPAFELSSSELDGIVAYIRAGFDPGGVAVRVGDAARGGEIFHGSGGCSECHRVRGSGPRLAPDLSDIGLLRTPAALQRTLLNPTVALLPIHRPVRIVTRDGETIRGRRLNEDTYTVQLIDSDERLRSLVKSELVEYDVSQVATMEPTTLAANDVADLIGYLLSLRGVQ